MLRKLYKCGLILSILVCGLPTMAQQTRIFTRDNDGQKRLALIIGNGSYVNARKLVNPPNDAADMTATLTELGFEVISGTNLNLKQMTEKVREFGDKLKTSGGVGLFYYAGHGVQVSGRNYLIPVEADIPREDEIGFVALDLNQVLQKMATANNGLNIVVLDACRNNPFARGWSRDASDDGLAQITAPKGTFIAYATSPDMTASDGTGRNGLYTTELLKYIKQPNLKIEETFKEVTKAVDDKSGGRQTPWFSSSLRGEFVFKLNEKTASVTKPNLTAKPILTEKPAPISSPAVSEKAKENEAVITSSLGNFDFSLKKELKGEIEVLFKRESPSPYKVRSVNVSGNLSEIKDKRKVYISAYYGIGLSKTEPTILMDSWDKKMIVDSSAKKIMVDKLTKYGVEIADTPETADFIIHYSGMERTEMAGGLPPKYVRRIDGNMIIVMREPVDSGGSVKAGVLW